jgi:hypothetical protein
MGKDRMLSGSTRRKRLQVCSDSVSKTLVSFVRSILTTKAQERKSDFMSHDADNNPYDLGRKTPVVFL